MVRLFIVDDSKVLRDRLRSLVSEIEGITIVGEADDPLKAIEVIGKFKPDVVILDIRMPGGNGMSIMSAIKKLKGAPKIIIFTNYPYLQYRKTYLDAGADFFFYKAAEFEKLIDLLKRLAKKL